MGTRCADHVTPLYPQKLALTSPTGGGRAVGIVRSRTKATEFSLVLCSLFSKKYPVIQIFCISGWLAVPINPDKRNSTILNKKGSPVSGGHKCDVYDENVGV